MSTFSKESKLTVYLVHDRRGFAAQNFINLDTAKDHVISVLRTRVDLNLDPVMLWIAFFIFDPSSPVAWRVSYESSHTPRGTNRVFFEDLSILEVLL